jgi:hypothetical protein
MSDSSLPPPLPVQPIVLGYSNPDLIPEQPLLPVPEKVFHFFTAIALPIACFGITALDRYFPGPRWQRGLWFDKLGLIPQFTVGWAFYPLLVVAMYAAGGMIFATRRSVDSVITRVCLFGGVILAWQYAFIHTVCIANNKDRTEGILLGIFLPLGLVAALLFLRWAANALIWSRHWYRMRRGQLYFWVAITLAVVTLVVMFGWDVVAGSAFGGLALAPGLTMFSFVAMSIVALRRGKRLESPLPVVGGLTAWFGAMAAAWVHSYSNATVAYAKLPLQSPGCYVVTAATRGHRRFVGRRLIDGRVVTPQLAVMKAGELAIQARWPTVHRVLRSMYDVIGPRLATGIRNPVIADLVYVSLKPIEWAIVFYQTASTGRCLRR